MCVLGRLFAGTWPGDGVHTSLKMLLMQHIASRMQFRKIKMCPFIRSLAGMVLSKNMRRAERHLVLLSYRFFLPPPFFFCFGRAGGVSAGVVLTFAGATQPVLCPFFQCFFWHSWLQYATFWQRVQISLAPWM